MSEPEKSNFENINDLLKACLWPLLVLIIFFTYRTEINQIVKVIPQKLENSSKISVGSLSFEIDKTAKNSGNEELGGIIKNLSENGIRKLLTLGVGNFGIIVQSDQKGFIIPRDYDVLMELEKDGLLKADQPLDQFLSYFKRLGAISTEAYKSDDGYTYNGPSERFNQKYTEFSLPLSKITPQQINQIKTFNVKLSPQGKKAFDIIVHVIGEQIKKN